MNKQTTTTKERVNKAWKRAGAALAIALGGAATAGPIGAVGDIYVVGTWTNAAGLTSTTVVQYDGPTGDFVGRFAVRDFGRFIGMAWGPNGNLFTSHAGETSGNWSIAEFDGQTGAFIQNVVDVQNGGFSIAKGLAFGPDGDLYVGDFFAQRIIRYDGTTFIEKSSTPTNEIVGTPNGMHFAPNGNLFVLSGGFNAIKEYNVSDGGVEFMGIFAEIPGSSQPQDFTWGPNGNIFITRGTTGGIAEVDGETGTFIDNFVPVDTALPTNGLVFDDFGRLIVSISSPVSRIDAYDAATGVAMGPFITEGFGIPQVISIKPGNNAPQPCSLADLAEPFGELNFFDVTEFIALYSANDASADLNGDGVFNFFDVSAFLSAYAAGCP